MDLAKYSFFIVASMILTVIAISVVSVSVAVVQDRGGSAVAFDALIFVIMIGLLMAMPIGVVTWVVGAAILNWIYDICADRWPGYAVELAGAAVSLVPFSILCLLTGGDFDLFAATWVSIALLLVTGIVIGALMARWTLRANDENADVGQGT